MSSGARGSESGGKWGGPSKLCPFHQFVEQIEQFFCWILLMTPLTWFHGSIRSFCSIEHLVYTPKSTPIFRSSDHRVEHLGTPRNVHNGLVAFPQSFPVGDFRKRPSMETGSGNSKIIIEFDRNKTSFSIAMPSDGTGTHRKENERRGGDKHVAHVLKR